MNFRSYSIAIAISLNLVLGAASAKATEAPEYSIANPDLMEHLWHESDNPKIRSLPATMAMTEKLVEQKPGFLQRRHVTVLYPGFCDHYTPLDIAHKLIVDGHIDTAQFILTEIDNNCLIRFYNTLRVLLDRKFYKNLQINLGPQAGEALTETLQEPGTGMDLPVYARGITYFSVLYNNRPITFKVAISMSGTAFYRSQQLQRADILYHHDVRLLDEETTGHREWAKLLEGASSRRLDRPLYVYSEDFWGNSDWFTARPPLYTRDQTSQPLRVRPVVLDLVGTTDIVNRGYGHCHGNLIENGAPAYPSAALTTLSSRILRDSKNDYGLSDNDYKTWIDFMMVAQNGNFRWNSAHAKKYALLLAEKPDFFVPIMEFARSTLPHIIGDDTHRQAVLAYARLKFSWYVYDYLYLHEDVHTPFVAFACRPNDFSDKFKESTQKWPRPTDDDFSALAAHQDELPRIFAEDLNNRDFKLEFMEVMRCILARPYGGPMEADAAALWQYLTSTNTK